MHRIFLFILLIGSFSGFAQKAGFTGITDVNRFRSDFAEQNSALTSIKSSFVQEKTLTMLTEKIVSTGEFYFKRSDKIRIEYTAPYHYLLIINGDQMISKNDQKESHVNTSSNKLFRQINRIIIDCVQGTILSSKDFSVNVFENQGSFLLHMTPQTKAIKEFFQSIDITLDKQDYSVSSIELNEQGGDKTLMRFTNKQLNMAIKDEVFTLR